MNLVRSGRCVALGPASFAAYHQVAAVPLTPWTEVCLCFICRRETLKQPEIAMPGTRHSGRERKVGRNGQKAPEKRTGNEAKRRLTICMEHSIIYRFRPEKKF